MFILDQSGSVSTVFEVKTDLHSTSIYTGIGQLLLNNVCAPGNPQKVLVIPATQKSTQSQLASSLAKLGIDVVTYRHQSDGVVFDPIRLG